MKVHVVMKVHVSRPGLHWAFRNKMCLKLFLEKRYRKVLDLRWQLHFFLSFLFIMVFLFFWGFIKHEVAVVYVEREVSL